MNGEAVAIVIPVWNGRQLLLTLLEKLRAQTYPISEIIAVDNGSEDGAADAAGEQGARVLRLGANRGFAAAVNEGVKAAGAGLVALVNTDIEPEPEWLERLAHALQPDDVWFATGKVLSARNRNYIDGTYDLISRAACAWRAGQGSPDSPAYSQARRIAMAPATAALFRAELFHRVGLFDTTFESYLEDVDFGLRCALGGYSGAYVPDAVAYHWGSVSFGAWNPEVVRHIARNQLYLIAKHYPPALRRRYWWPILMGQLLWGFVALRHGAGLAFCKGKLSAVGQLYPPPDPQSAPRLAAILQESEGQIRHAQQNCPDLYWRVYFLLTSGGAAGGEN
jgi:GT2 family glycosyltransferase